MDTSYLTTQVSTIIGQLHALFEEIGVTSQERDARETELFTALSETLHNQLRLVTAEKAELHNEANRIIKTVKQMEASLDDNANDQYQLDDGDLKVTVPLTRCLHGLKEKHNAIAKVHRERFEQVKEYGTSDPIENFNADHEQNLFKPSNHILLISSHPSSESNSRLLSNSASLPPKFDLSPSYINSLDNEFSRVYEEYTRRISSVKQIAEDIVNLWAELGTPQAQTESSIVKYYRDSPEQLGLHEDDMKRLQTKRDRLIEEKRGRERKIQELKSTVGGLWDRLGVEEPDRKRFLASNRGCGLRAINEFEAELDRLNELKRQNLHLFR